MSTPIRYLTPDDAPLPPRLARPEVSRMTQDELAEPDALCDACAVLVPMHADQRQLAAVRPVLEGFLETGGTAVVCGQIAHPFLAELRPFVPLARMRPADLAVRIEAPHPVWAGVGADDLTFRRGVAGFYGRGENPPPVATRILTTVGHGRMAVDWLLHRSGGGRLLMHGGNDLWSFADDATSAARLAPQLIAWLLDAPRGVA
jgi:hypothetical protein